MIMCQMTCVIQNILLSHYLHNIHLCNYGLPHVLENVMPYCVFTLICGLKKKVNFCKQNCDVVKLLFQLL